MLEIKDQSDSLYRRLQEAKLLFKNSSDKHEKVALANYIGNLYDAIGSVSDKKLIVKKKIYLEVKNIMINFIDI